MSKHSTTNLTIDTCAQINAYTCMHACTHIQAHTQTHNTHSTHTHTHKCIYVHKHICMHVHKIIRMHVHYTYIYIHIHTRDVTIHILGVLIYHLLCITTHWYTVCYSIVGFCRWTETFFQNHHVLYLPNSYRTVKLAYNYSISHNTVHIICSVEVKTLIYQAWYSIYADIWYIDTT